jgi:arginase family enzyme
VPTTAIFFPFDLFGSPGTSAGVDALWDACREMVADNRRERLPTRARAYAERLRLSRLAFDRIEDYRDWRLRGRRAVRRVWREGNFLVWITGNHLGALPVYDELSASDADTLVVQFDAHLDVQNFAECSNEPSHGNFLLHCAGPLPPIINVGHRDLLLPAKHVSQFYRCVFSAETAASDPQRVVRNLRKRASAASRVFLDFDCDVLDPAFFPGVAHPVPFGLAPSTLLRFLDAVWSERVAGIAISEFDAARDRNDECLAMLIWLLERLLLKRYETAAMDHE